MDFKELKPGLPPAPDNHPPLWFWVLIPDKNLAASLFSLPLAQADLELRPFSVVTPSLPQHENSSLESCEAVINVFEDLKLWGVCCHQVVQPRLSPDPLLPCFCTPFPLCFLLTLNSSLFMLQKVYLWNLDTFSIIWDILVCFAEKEDNSRLFTLEVRMLHRGF